MESISGRRISREEAFAGLGDPDKWQAESEATYAEFRSKRGMLRLPIQEFRVVTKRIKIVPPSARGLGDTVKRITDVTGITKVVQFVERTTGWHCWCPKVQAYLNAMLPYKNSKGLEVSIEHR